MSEVISGKDGHNGGKKRERIGLFSRKEVEQRN